MTKKLNIKRVAVAVALTGSLIVGGFSYAANALTPDIQWVEITVAPGDTPLSLVGHDRHLLPDFINKNDVQQRMGQSYLQVGQTVVVPVSSK